MTNTAVPTETWTKTLVSDLDFSLQSLRVPDHNTLCTCYPRSLSVLLACASALLSGRLVTPPPPSVPPSPPVKSHRGPDHSQANMWFELASQKQASIRGAVCVPPELGGQAQLVSSISVCVCVCSLNPTAGSKGQLKSQHIVSPETQQKIKIKRTCWTLILLFLSIILK